MERKRVNWYKQSQQVGESMHISHTRYRGSIWTDLWVPKQEDKKNEMHLAQDMLNRCSEIVNKKTGNAYADISSIIEIS